MLALVLLRLLVVETFAVVAESMTPTLRAGDRLVVLKTAAIERGDLIVFDGEQLLGAQDLDGGARVGTLARLLGADPTTAYVKRVIGVPGDQVVCCDDGGRLTVNGERLEEPYREGPTDQVTFEVTVPADRYWVLGDNRGDSADSRSALGRPGGGMLRETDIVGEAVWRYWPPGRVGGVGEADAAHTDRAAGGERRAVGGVSHTAGGLTEGITTEHGKTEHGTTEHGTTGRPGKEQA